MLEERSIRLLRKVINYLLISMAQYPRKLASSAFGFFSEEK
jgi:hypothetical protein